MSQIRRIQFASVAIILLIALSAAAAMAQQDSSSFIEGDEVATNYFLDRKLDMNLTSDTGFYFTTSADAVDVTIHVRNPTGQDMKLYVAREDGSSYTIIKEARTIEPGFDGDVRLSIPCAYNGRVNEDVVFGVIGVSGGKFFGNYFTASLDWSGYQNEFSVCLSGIGCLSFVVLAALLFIFASSVFVVSATAKHTVVRPREYTLKTLFMPITRMRPFAENVANIVINPLFWGIELVFAITLVSYILWASIFKIPSELGLEVFIIGGMLAFVTPLAFLFVAWLLDVYEREPFRFVLAMFMWGMLAAFFAFTLNNSAGNFLEIAYVFLPLSPAIIDIIAGSLIAPLTEETSKGLGVLAVSGHHEMDGTFDGMLYGFCVGLGFAAVENWLYFSAHGSPVGEEGILVWIIIIAYRSVACALGHASYTAITGAFIGFMKSRITKGTKLYGQYDKVIRYCLYGFLIGLPIAMLCHGVYNLSTSIVDTGNVFLDLTLLFGGDFMIFLVLCAVGIVLQYNIRKRKKAKRKGDFKLSIGKKDIPLAYGTLILEQEIPGLKSGSDTGVIAEVNRNPSDPTVLGLKNLSDTTWKAINAEGAELSIEQGKSIKLADGTGIDFGQAAGTVKK